MKKLTIIFVASLLIGCGGGGGGGGTSGGTNSPGFNTEDFSGKSLYYVAAGVYQPGTFYPDGTAKASDLMSFGTPVLQPETVSWSVVNGELMIHDPVTGDNIRYVLLSNDAAARYFRAESTHSRECQRGRNVLRSSHRTQSGAGVYGVS